MGKFFMGAQSGLTRGELRAALKDGVCVKVGHDLYRRGANPPTQLDVSLGAAFATDGTVGGEPAAILLRFERYGSWSTAPDITLPPGVGTRRAKGGRFRRRILDTDRIIVVDGIRCTDPLQTLIDLAALVTDDVWEQALEGALRARQTSIEAVTEAAKEAGRNRIPGAARMRRVLARRPAGAPPTGSVLETMAIQMLRLMPAIPTPERQVVVYGDDGTPFAALDVAWPTPGAFMELDGEGHKGQPTHDAWRETAVVSRTGWLPARATWTQVTRGARSTARAVLGVLRQAGLKV